MSIDGNSTSSMPSKNSCVIDCSIATMDIESLGNYRNWRFVPQFIEMQCSNAITA